MTIPLLNSNTRQQRAPIVIDVKDNDEMFMRNQNRSSKAWQKLEKINKGGFIAPFICALAVRLTHIALNRHK